MQRCICFFLWLHHMAFRIVVPQPGVEPTSLAVKAWSPTHWITREFPLGSRLTSSESIYSTTKTTLLPSPTDLSFLPLGRGVIQTDSRALRFRINRPLDLYTFPSATNIIPLHA